ncbi:MAG: E3 ubiquitin ligase family protein [Ruminococcus sp.]|nr:E3 ubiquitin ligase family protein [Ruminococcus sp.]
MGLVFLGLALIALGVYLAWFMRRKTGDALLDIQATQTSTIADVKESMADMASISDSYREYVELKGTVKSKNPQKAPFSQKDAAFYRAITYRVYEEEEIYTDSEGNRKKKLVKKEDKISEEESGEELVLTDANGDSITMETVGVSSAFDLVETVDRFEPVNSYNANNFYQNPRRRFTNFDNGFFGGGARMLGYRMVEQAFLTGQKLYLLGDAYMNGGELTFGKPTEKGKQYIVTAKSEEQLVSSKESSQKMQLIGGIACAVIGVILIISGIVK